LILKVEIESLKIVEEPISLLIGECIVISIELIEVKTISDVSLGQDEISCAASGRYIEWGKGISGLFNTWAHPFSHRIVSG
jgi:hypothetical protein